MTVSEGLKSLNIAGSNYQYSAVGLDNLGATEYTLVTIACDTSSSVTDFKNEMESALKEIVNACRKSPRADNLMLRLVTFNDSEYEVHGYKLLSQCNPDDYDNCLNIGGMTALYEAAHNSIIATKDYGKNLIHNDFDANAILFIITDGENNRHPFTSDCVREEIKKIQKEECLESFVSVLIGVNVIDAQITAGLTAFQNEAGLTQYVEVQDASSKTLAKLAQFVSRSISSQSTSLGSGQASNQQSLTI